jgi:hypothetical protein
MDPNTLDVLPLPVPLLCIYLRPYYRLHIRQVYCLHRRQGMQFSAGIGPADTGHWRKARELSRTGHWDCGMHGG